MGGLLIAPHGGLLVVLSGPSGVGKGTVVARAMAFPGETAARIRHSISVTTRPPRPNEVDGVDYFFRSPDEFTTLVARGALLEWATYLDHAYGTPVEFVDQQLAAGNDVVLEIEVQGAMQVKTRRPEAVLVYVLPPSWEELEQRLARRGSDDAATQQRRFAVAKKEIEYLDQYHYVIVNDVVAAAAGHFLAILEAERWRVSRLDIARLPKT